MRLRFPWQRRAERARVHRVDAQATARRVRAEWPPIREAAQAVSREHAINGWTGTVSEIWERQRRGK